MKPTLVTGATGLVGYSIVQALRARGTTVRALVRSPERARAVLDPAVELVRGDLTDRDSVVAAVEGCEVVYHCGGLPEQWLPDESTFDRVNAQGTQFMVDASITHGVSRFVFTSTIDVFESTPGESFDEATIAVQPKATAYQRSKQKADRIVAEAIENGLDAVFLHPSGVYGPGPTASRSLNTFLWELNTGEVPVLLPGFMPLVYSEDVARGHLLAAEKGKAGDRFILSDAFLSLHAISDRVAQAGNSKPVTRTLPLWVAGCVSAVGEGISSITKKPPLIPRGQLTFLRNAAAPSARHARNLLGWEPTPFPVGLRQTLEWLENEQRGA